jgi:hypothetical protein
VAFHRQYKIARMCAIPLHWVEHDVPRTKDEDTYIRQMEEEKRELTVGQRETARLPKPKGFVVIASSLR